MVGDITEVTQLLCKAVEKNNNKNEEKEKESAKNDVKSCDTDTIDKITLDKTIKSYAKNDRQKKEDIRSKAPSNNGGNEDDEYEDDNQDNDLSQSIESSAISLSDQDSYDCVSYSDDCNELDEDEYPSDFDEWLKKIRKSIDTEETCSRIQIRFCNLFEYACAKGE